MYRGVKWAGPSRHRPGEARRHLGPARPGPYRCRGRLGLGCDIHSGPSPGPSPDSMWAGWAGPSSKLL